MKIKNISELFSFKGLRAVLALIAFAYLVGFLAGLLLEKYYGFRGKEVLFLDLPIKNTLGIISAAGSFFYFVWLLLQNSKHPETLLSNVPESYPIRYKIGKDAELLLSNYVDAKTSNLKLISKDKTIWVAELYENSLTHPFVSFDLVKDRLWANTWTCYRCEISLQTGKMISATFTK